MIKTVKITFTCLFCSLTFSAANAQNKPDADSLFIVARDAAFADNWVEARRVCRYLLSEYPDYYDAIILIGRTYAWEQKTDSSRMEVTPLLDIEPDNYDVLSLLADNEIWGKEYDKALAVTDKALLYYPADEEFIFRKANALYLKGDNTSAIKVLHQLLTSNPDHEAGNNLLNTILPPKTFVDELYDKAEEEARAGNWEHARQYARKVLAEEPENYPASLLITQTYAWENKFDSARIATRELAAKHPNNYDILDLAVNIEIWNRKYKDAIIQVDKALSMYPRDGNFLYKKAWIQYLSKEYKSALQTLNKLFEINPDHEEGNELYKNIMENHRYRDYVFLESYFEHFKKPYLSRKLITSAGLSKWTKYGNYKAEVNMGNELPYESLALQYEVEAYQQLFPTNYLLLNYAFSADDDLFPEHRGAFEFFQRLPKGFEISLGVRFLYWDDFTWIYTGSVSWLKDKNYLAFRPFFNYNGSRWISSYTFTYRRYFSPKEDYVYAMAGFGTYSDNFIHFNDNPGSSYMAQLGMLKFITVRWFVLASVGYAYDDGYRNRFQAQAGVRYYFNMFK
jgi:YaiO family outer membrane protein